MITLDEHDVVEFLAPIHGWPAGTAAAVMIVRADEPIVLVEVIPDPGEPELVEVDARFLRLIRSAVATSA